MAESEVLFYTEKSKTNNIKLEGFLTLILSSCNLQVIKNNLADFPTR